MSSPVLPAQGLKYIFETKQAPRFELAQYNVIVDPTPTIRPRQLIKCKLVAHPGECHAYF